MAPSSSKSPGSPLSFLAAGARHQFQMISVEAGPRFNQDGSILDESGFLAIARKLEYGD